MVAHGSAVKFQDNFASYHMIFILHVSGSLYVENYTVLSSFDNTSEAVYQYEETNSTASTMADSMFSGVVWDCPKEGCMYGLLNDMQVSVVCTQIFC